MSQNYLSKYKYFLYIVLGLGLLAGLGLYLFYRPTPDHADDLQVMKLNKEAGPLFKMESQLVYTPDLLDHLEASMIEHDDSALADTAATTTLNMAIYMSDELLETAAADLTTLSASVSKLTISLLPSESLDDQTYIALCDKLYRLFAPESTDKTTFIIYPQDISKLKQYDALTNVYQIGVNVSTLRDFHKLEAIVQHFKSTALFVREDFINSYAGDIGETSKEISTFYYLLAIRHPQVTTIFSPFMKEPWGVANAFSLKTSDPNYGVYQNIYARLLNEPWLTTKDVTLGNNSPYTLLRSYDTLSGMESLILAPDATLIGDPAKEGVSTYSDHLISYKLEEEGFSIQNYYPYLLRLDTTTKPNGITRLKAIATDATGRAMAVQSIDLTITNETHKVRAARYLEDTVFDTSPIYSSSYIPILMYHSIADEVAEEDQNHTVQTQMFEAQMKALIDHGYTPINFKMLHAYLEGANGLPEKPILITMDDGYLNNYTHAYPIYKKYNIAATLFVSSYYMKEDNTDRHFGWVAAKEMENSGLIDIQSHGYNHTPLRYLSLKDVRYHVSHSRGLIEKYLGKRDVFVVAYPQFRNTIYTRKLLSQIGVDFQITNLAIGTGVNSLRTNFLGTGLKASNLKRINVPNTMSPDELIATLEEVTR